jgi:hypothetical protein
MPGDVGGSRENETDLCIVLAVDLGDVFVSNEPEWQGT